jgi:hypothetical protein
MFVAYISQCGHASLQTAVVDIYPEQMNRFL